MAGERMAVTFDGLKLKAGDVLKVVRPDAAGRFARARLAPAARARIIATREKIDAELLTDDAPLIYAFNTGVGLFKDRRIAMAEMADYQRRTIYAHATGIGDPLPEEVVRATMLLRANAFASSGKSGASPALAMAARAGRRLPRKSISASSKPHSAPAIWASGARSPDAPTEPWAGMTG
jgi:histidine ammonia-lyase